MNEANTLTPPFPYAHPPELAREEDFSPLQFRFALLRMRAIKLTPDKETEQKEIVMKSRLNCTLLKFAMGSTLPAGNYSFLMERGQGAKVQIIRGGKPVAFVVEQGYHSSGRVRSAWLTVERTSAGNTVRELSLPSIGKVLHYAPNKPRRNSAAEERQIAQLIPITTAAN
jgi:hypothetical protein